MINAIVITASGLDSLLAIKLLEQTNISYKVIHFDIGLTYNKPIVAGQRISKYFGLEDLIKNSIEIDKFDIAKEFYSYILNIRDFTQYNACLEHKIFILKKAKEYMQNIGAQFIVTGDVVDQRPLIQGKEALQYIDKQAGIENIIFRPLSALLLPKSPLLTTYPELSTIMYDFTGFTKKRIELANSLHLVYAPPSTGKEQDNTELIMGKKAFEIFEKQKYINISHLHRVGLHFKLDEKARCVIGRTPFESNYLKNFYEKLEKKDFSFSYQGTRFLFGFVYDSPSSDEYEDTALRLFSTVIAKNKEDPIIQLYDHESLPLGSKKISPFSQQEFTNYLLHSNEVFCPICPLDIDNNYQIT